LELTPDAIKEIKLHPPHPGAEVLNLPNYIAAFLLLLSQDSKLRAIFPW
jgi:hypothetical protein